MHSQSYAEATVDSLTETKIDQKFTLPPSICLNTREKIKTQKVDVNDLALQNRKKCKQQAPVYNYAYPEPNPNPVTKFPLSLMWTPDQIRFDIKTDVIISHLRIWNNNLRPVYVKCCGLWDDTARLGASWFCYPRTRLLIPPGLKAEVTIQATPKFHSPVPLAYIGLQLAAAHMRDNVTGYFVVPVVVKFDNFKPEYEEEGES